MSVSHICIKCNGAGLISEKTAEISNEDSLLKLASQVLHTTPDRLRELAEADRDGRCVVLPVKEGETVYHIDVHPFEDYPPEIFELPFHITDYYNIGNTVFLTEQEAEAALKEEE